MSWGSQWEGEGGWLEFLDSFHDAGKQPGLVTYDTLIFSSIFTKSKGKIILVSFFNFVVHINSTR